MKESGRLPPSHPPSAVRLLRGGRRARSLYCKPSEQRGNGEKDDDDEDDNDNDEESRTSETREENTNGTTHTLGRRKAGKKKTREKKAGNGKERGSR